MNSKSAIIYLIPNIYLTPTIVKGTIKVIEESRVFHSPHFPIFVIEILEQKKIKKLA